MSKEELLKYLIAEIDLIMHDKDYRFENANGTWYSRESCRDLTNEEVFEELRTELRQFADLETKLAESEKSKESYRLQNEHHHLQLLQFYSRLGVEAFGADIHEKALETLMIMKEQLAEKDKEIEYQESMKILAVENQNKKAIEQLEKVKGLIANHTQELWTCENDDIDVVLYEEIDKQIKRLKEMK